MNLAHQAESVLAPIVQSTHKRTDKISTGSRRQNSLGGGKHQCNIGTNAFLASCLTAAKRVRGYRDLTTTLRIRQLPIPGPRSAILSVSLLTTSALMGSPGTKLARFAGQQHDLKSRAPLSAARVRIGGYPDKTPQPAAVRTSSDRLNPKPHLHTIPRSRP